MRHDTGAGRELIRQFNEAKVLAIEHTSVERQLGERSGDTRHSESYGAFHLATSHLGVYHIVVQRVET